MTSTLKHCIRVPYITATSYKVFFVFQTNQTRALVMVPLGFPQTRKELCNNTTFQNLLIWTEHVGLGVLGGGGGGGALNFFSGLQGCAAQISEVWGLRTDICLWKGGLWSGNFQIWGLVSWKFPNLRACELKFGWKLRLQRLKFQHFLIRGLVNWLF